VESTDIYSGRQAPFMKKFSTSLCSSITFFGKQINAPSNKMKRSHIPIQNYHYR